MGTMTRRSTEAWWRQHWGPPCKLHDPITVTIGRAKVRVDGRAAAAFEAFEMVRARHGYDIRPAYPEGDTGTYNCRHIGNDEDRPMSVHAWGCAIDANWQTNPDGSRLVTDMPQAMRDDLHALRTRAGAPVFRWGGDWDRDPRTGHSYYDAMHWEIVATPAELATGIIDPRHQEDEVTPEDIDAIAAKVAQQLSPTFMTTIAEVEKHVDATATRLETHITKTRDGLAALQRRLTTGGDKNDHDADAAFGRAVRESLGL